MYNNKLTKCDYCNYLKDKVKIPYKKLWNMEIGKLEYLYQKVKKDNEPSLYDTIKTLVEVLK